MQPDIVFTGFSIPSRSDLKDHWIKAHNYGAVSFAMRVVIVPRIHSSAALLKNVLG